MEKYIQKAEKCLLKKITFLAIILIAIVFPGFAQESTEISNSAIVEDELTQTEIISYIAMIVGFAALITFAWWSTARAKKRSEEAQHHTVVTTPKMQTFTHHPNDPYRKQKARGRKYH